MTQNTEQNVRTRDEQAIWEHQTSAGRWVRSESQEYAENWAEVFGTNCRALYTRPANVAALEARIAELTEAEQLARADAEASKARVKVLEEGIARIEKQANEYPGDDAGALGWISSECAALTREGEV